MTVQATPANIEWLLEKLYLAKRGLSSVEIENPTFVLLAKDKEDRLKIEGIIMGYFALKYGFDWTDPQNFRYDIYTFSESSTFRFPEHDIVITVINL